MQHRGTEAQPRRLGDADTTGAAWDAGRIRGFRHQRPDGRPRWATKQHVTFLSCNQTNAQEHRQELWANVFFEYWDFYCMFEVLAACIANHIFRIHLA